MSDTAEAAARTARAAIASAVLRYRENASRRAVGAIVALAIEALLLLALLMLGQSQAPPKPPAIAVSSFDVQEPSESPKPETKPEPEHATARAVPEPPQQQPPSAEAAAPAEPPAAIIPVSPQQMQSFDISKLPRAPAKPLLVGPVDTPRFGDSERVGTAPNGQPMYAARWYPSEPTQQEMAGYLSTAEGPGWADIACKTVKDNRVEECVGLDEYPEGSHIMRAELAAAWQFHIRPPQVGGILQVGDWVRIHLTYESKPARSYGDPASR